MTALNFYLSKEAVCVVADTLVTDVEQPAFFTTKVFPVPHLNGLLCGRGSLGLMLDWLTHLSGGMLAFNMMHADPFVPDALRRLYSERPLDEQANCTTSIYHLGFDPSDNEFCGFAYRSVNDFESEPLAYGIHIKPAIGIELDLHNFPADFIPLMRQQRIEQDQLPANERAFVGGQILSWMMLRLDRENADPIVQTVIEPAYEWEDYTSMFIRCAERLPEL